MNKVDKIFKENIQRIVEHGVWDEGARPKWADGTEAKSKFITHVFETYDLDAGEFPLTSLRKIAWKSGIKEILWIYQDQSNDLSLLKNKYNVHWWDEWESKDLPGTIGNRYGHTVRKHDQINRLIKSLKETPYSRRHIMSLWDWQDFDSSDGLYPCAFETQWSVRGGYLDMTLMQRSSDYMMANHINKIQYVALQMMIASECGLKPGKFSHYVNNLHIYDRHLDIAKKLLYTPVSAQLPKLELTSKPFYDIIIDDFTLTNYKPLETDVRLEIAI